MSRCRERVYAGAPDSVTSGIACVADNRYENFPVVGFRVRARWYLTA
jgi:hypothetical protein